MRNHILLLLILTLITVNKIQAQNRIQEVKGTFLVLAYQDERNKYMYPMGFDNTDPQMWKAKIRELHKMGIEYVIFQQIANDGKAFYPSSIMPRGYDESRQSPVDAVMEESSKLGMKVFMSIGWAKDQLDDLEKPDTRARYMQILTELAGIYGGNKALYGWYLPVEACLGPVLPDFAVDAVNEFVAKVQSLTPGKKTMISPFGFYCSDFNDPHYATAISRLKVDIIAYQDEVGCVREPLPIPNLRDNWKKMRAIHDKTSIQMWANCESFTWEKGTNSWYSALIPAAFPRFLSQLELATEARADCIISFSMFGIYDDPDSPYHLGQPYWSSKTYQDYIAWKNGDEYWSLCASAFLRQLHNTATNAKIQDNEKGLLDNELAQEDPSDSHWVRYGKGSNEIIIDLLRTTEIKKVFLRTLNYHLKDIGLPVKIYIFTSEDGIKYDLSAIQDGPYFPNDNHDAWIDGILFNNLNRKSRYVKIAFSCLQPVYIDEIFINPKVMSSPYR